ncbi:hypothetical protein BGZ93_002520 [Podila epicladia]|nr:hypothetical protein BGZ93_002520 [Podila epicladia]
MSNGLGNYEPGGMATISPLEDASLRSEQFQEHQLRLQEKYRLAHQHQMDLEYATSTHPHDLPPNDGTQPYYTSQGQLIVPTASPYYEARPQYGLTDFDLLETLDGRE